MRIVTLAIVLSMILQVSVGWCWDDGDFQIWHTEQQEFIIEKKTRLTLEEEFKWGDDASDFYYHHYDAGLLYEINKNIDIGMGFRKIFEEKKNIFKAETRPHLNVIMKADAGGWKLEDRNRIEQRFIESSKDYGRYSNKMSVKLPFKMTRFKIQPFVADEIFVDLDKINLSRNRLSGGLGAALFKNIKGEVYYMLQSSKSAGVWSDLNVMGFKMKVSF